MLPPDDRITSIAERCRAANYPDGLVASIEAYLRGQGSINAVEQQWNDPETRRRQLDPRTMIMLTTPESGTFDDIDRRLIDLCVAICHVFAVMDTIAAEGPVDQLHSYLVASGFNEFTALGSTNSGVRSNLVLPDGTPSALGRLMLRYAPDRFDAVRAATDHRYPTTAYVQLLLAADPPYIDLAWQIVRQLPDYQHNEYVAMLLRADPERFEGWARELATSPGSHMIARRDVLNTLVRHFPDRYLDQVIAAARIAPLHQWEGVELQSWALKTLYRIAPEQAFAPLAEASLSSNNRLSGTAVMVLAHCNKEQSRPILQTCVADGPVETAAKALDVLLTHPWPEQLDYVVALLAHRAATIRASAIRWLLVHAADAVDRVVPLLAHRSAFARQAAVQVLQHRPNQTVRDMLSQHLHRETSVSVKRLILNIPGIIAEQPDNDPPDEEQITAEATSAMSHLHTAPQPGFDIETAAFRWRTGEPVPLVVLHYLLHRQRHGPRDDSDRLLRTVASLVERSTSADWALGALNQWNQTGQRAHRAWALPVIGAFADDRLIDLLSPLIEKWGVKSYEALTTRSLEALALIGSELAYMMLALFARRRTDPVSRFAAQVLARTAQQLGRDPAQMMVPAVPRLGFDARGERQLCYGSRTYTLRIDTAAKVYLLDQQGRRRTGLPAPRAGDNDAVISAAQAEWRVLTRQLRRVQQALPQVLEDALVSRRQWTVVDWQVQVVDHPLLRHVASKLVWGLVVPDSATYRFIFRPLADGTLTTVTDERIELPDHGQIQLIHPQELDPAVCDAWLQHLADYECIPPVPQLNRPVFRHELSPSVWWHGCQGWIVETEALYKTGWHMERCHFDNDDCLIWSRPIGGTTTTMLLDVRYESGHNHLRIFVQRLGFTHTVTKPHQQTISEAYMVQLDAVSPIIFSEAVAFVQQITVGNL